MKRLVKSAWIAAQTLGLSALPVFAQGPGQPINLSPTGNFAVLNDLTIAGIIAGLIRVILVVAAIVFFFILIIGGIRWIISGGDKAQTEAARGQITAALVGLVIVFAAWAIIQLINTLFGINIFSLTITNFY